MMMNDRLADLPQERVERLARLRLGQFRGQRSELGGKEVSFCQILRRLKRLNRHSRESFRLVRRRPEQSQGARNLSKS